MRPRSYAIAASLIVLIVAGYAGPTLARPKLPDYAQKACEAGGYLWSTTKGCANKSCSHNGKTYQPGESRLGPPVLGMKRVTYWCDGFSGAWATIGVPSNRN